MSKKSTDTQTDLSEVNRIRLERDLTYEQLAEQIGIDSSALFRLLNEPARKPHDRTMFKIRRFLEQALAS